MSSWAFARYSSLEAHFEEQLLLRADRYSLELVRVVQQKLEEIRRRPCTANPYTVDGLLMHSVQTPGFRIGQANVPPLLIAYTLDYQHRLIHLVEIVPLAEVALHPTHAELEAPRYSDGPEPEPFERVLLRAFALAERWQAH